MSDAEIKNEDINETDEVSAVPALEAVFADEPVSAPHRLPVGRQLMVVGLLLFGVFSLGGASYIYGQLDSDGGEQGANAVEVLPREQQENKGGDADPFSSLSIIGQSAIVIDAKSGEVLFEKSPDLKWPLASITKLMTALVAKEIVDENKIIPITDESLKQVGDSGLKIGEQFSYQNLSDLILLSSSNDGAFALASAAGRLLSNDEPAATFVKAMNVRAKELGLDSTYFRNPTGLDISETEAGAYGTASDVATLIGYLVENYPEVLEETTKRSRLVYNESGEGHEAENTNRIVDSIPGVIASKTGYTTLSGGNLAVAFDAGIDHPVIVVVLGSTHQGRFSDVFRLVEAAREQLKDEN